MRVFNFVGLTEALTEIREHFEADTSRVDAEAQSLGDARQTAGMAEVADSEDEDDEDMVLDPAPREKNDAREKGIVNGEDTPASGRQLGLVLIDNITRVISPLMKSNYVQGMFTYFDTSRTH